MWWMVGRTEEEEKVFIDFNRQSRWFVVSFSSCRSLINKNKQKGLTFWRLRHATPASQSLSLLPFFLHLFLFLVPPLSERERQENWFLKHQQHHNFCRFIREREANAFAFHHLVFAWNQKERRQRQREREREIMPRTKKRCHLWPSVLALPCFLRFLIIIYSFPLFLFLLLFFLANNQNYYTVVPLLSSILIDCKQKRYNLLLCLQFIALPIYLSRLSLSSISLSLFFSSGSLAQAILQIFNFAGDYAYW